MLPQGPSKPCPTHRPRLPRRGTEAVPASPNSPQYQYIYIQATAAMSTQAYPLILATFAQ